MFETDRRHNPKLDSLLRVRGFSDAVLLRREAMLESMLYTAASVTGNYPNGAAA